MDPATAKAAKGRHHHGGAGRRGGPGAGGRSSGHHTVTANTVTAAGLKAGGGAGQHNEGRRHKTISAADGRNVATKAAKGGGKAEMDASSGEYLDGGTPTPSEKVSRWHRDIFLVSPPTTAGGKGEGEAGGTGRAKGDAGTGQVVHPRQCICDQCIAEYGTFKFYNQILQAEAAKGGGGGGSKADPKMLMPGGTIKAKMVNADTVAKRQQRQQQRQEIATSPVSQVSFVGRLLPTTPEAIMQSDIRMYERTGTESTKTGSE